MLKLESLNVQHSVSMVFNPLQFANVLCNLPHLRRLRLHQDIPPSWFYDLTETDLPHLECLSAYTPTFAALITGRPITELDLSLPYFFSHNPELETQSNTVLTALGKSTRAIQRLCLRFHEPEYFVCRPEFHSTYIYKFMERVLSTLRDLRVVELHLCRAAGQLVCPYHDLGSHCLHSIRSFAIYIAGAVFLILESL